jgi:hypothetical protein
MTIYSGTPIIFRHPRKWNSWKGSGPRRDRSGREELKKNTSTYLLHDGPLQTGGGGGGRRGGRHIVGTLVRTQTVVYVSAERTSEDGISSLF